MALARRIGQQESPAAAVAAAMTPEGIFFYIALAGLIGPIIEELLFRGLLYRTWEAQWGWIPAMLMSSALFAAYHPVPFSAFASAILFVAIYRRTGSLWAAIVVHGVGNILQSPLLLGRFIFPTSGKETGEIELWLFHLSALALLVGLLAFYVWISRDRVVDPADHQITQIHCT